MAPISVEFEGDRKLPTKNEGILQRINVGDDIGISYYSDNTNKLVIFRKIINGNEEDKFRPRIIPKPETPPAIVHLEEKGKEYEILEALALKTGDVVTRKIRYLKDNKVGEINSVFRCHY